MKFSELVNRTMMDLPYSLVIEATVDSNFFGFYSPELAGFTGIGHSFNRGLRVQGEVGHGRTRLSLARTRTARPRVKHSSDNRDPERETRGSHRIEVIRRDSAIQQQA